MAALSGEKTLAELSSEFGVHPTMISTWKQELVKRASELFARGNKAPAVDDAKVIDDLHRKIGQLYQPPYPVTGLAQVRLVREAIRSGISIILFQAFWQASRMDS